MVKNPFYNHSRKMEGSMLIYAVVVIFIFSLVLVGVLGYANVQLKLIRGTVNREQAFQIAEAGVNYYQWHLAHFISDYADGSGQTGCNPCGPYIHQYTDTDNSKVIGSYEITVTPPSVGSTVVTIKSVGYTTANPAQKRTITVKYGIPSLAQYAFLTNSDAWIGSSETVNGEFHTNGGVRFDGNGNAPIESSKLTYQCVPTFGCSPTTTKAGIWGAANQATKNYWSFPVPNVDFSAMTADLATLKSSAQTSGLYLPPSNAQGYSLVFRSNGTVDFYKVTSLANDPTGWDVNGVAHNSSIDYNGRTLLYNKPIPANGVVYIEDRTWVEGMVTGRVMVVAAKLPYNANTAPSIIIAGNLCYTVCGSNRDQTSSLGLLSQQDVLIAYGAPSSLEVDGALIAQNGSTQWYYYPGVTKTLITIYGAIGSFGTWTWSWVDGGGNCTSGYCSTNTTYDASLLYAPPPSFPLTSSGYQQISWSSN